jgi:hypothetical protein
MGLRNQYLGGIGGLEGQGFQGSEFQSQLSQKYYEDMANAKAAQDEGRAGGWANALGAGASLLFGKNAGGLFGGGQGGAQGGQTGQGGQGGDGSFAGGFGQGFSDAFQGGSTWLDPDVGHYFVGG